MVKLAEINKSVIIAINVPHSIQKQTYIILCVSVANNQNVNADILMISEKCFYLLVFFSRFFITTSPVISNTIYNITQNKIQKL